MFLLGLCTLVACTDELSLKPRDAGDSDSGRDTDEAVGSDGEEPGGDREPAADASAETDGGSVASTSMDGGSDRIADASPGAADAGGRGSGGDGDSGDAAVREDAGTATAPPYGLDARPSNSTCVAPARGTLPATLKASGCVDLHDATKPAAGLIAYNVNSPLWSDGAEKQRFLALPDTTKIHIDNDGDWNLPAGAVLMKTFLLGGKRIETRLFVRHTDGWAGYSYQWNDAQTDATLLPDMTVDQQLGAQTWTFPSRKQCMECHTEGAGFSLGLETGQLNGDFTYPNGRRANQLATLDKIGLFDAPLPGLPATLVRFPTPTSTEGTPEARGKSYVHANCSGCHRGNAGPGMIKFDMRYQTPLAQMNICNVTSKKKEFGTAVLAPGNPMDSAMLGHMRSTTKMRMPPLGTSLVDQAGSLAVENWVKAVVACP